MHYFPLYIADLIFHLLHAMIQTVLYDYFAFVFICFLPKITMKLLDAKKRKTRFPMARVKKIMQSNEDIGKVSTSAPVVLSKAAELFIKELVGSIIKHNKGKIGIEELVRVVRTESKFEFLKNVITKE